MFVQAMRQAKFDEQGQLILAVHFGHYSSIKVTSLGHFAYLKNNLIGPVRYSHRRKIVLICEHRFWKHEQGKKKYNESTSVIHFSFLKLLMKEERCCLPQVSDKYH